MNRQRHRVLTALFLCALAVIPAACGQRGDLFLPADEPPAEGAQKGDDEKPADEQDEKTPRT